MQTTARRSQAQRRNTPKWFRMTILVALGICLCWFPTLVSSEVTVKVKPASSTATNNKKKNINDNEKDMQPQKTDSQKIAELAAKQKAELTKKRIPPVELTSENFGSLIGDGNVWLIEFYTPWCTHCQKFSAAYNNIAAKLHGNPNENIKVAKVDCTKERALKTRFGIRSFPSFYVVDGYSVYQFEQKSRTENSIMEFARGGYKEHDAIPFLHSPMGPMGLLQGLLIFAGTRIMSGLQWLQDAYGIPPVIAGMIACGVGIFGGIISIVLLTVLTTPKSKRD